MDIYTASEESWKNGHKVGFEEGYLLGVSDAISEKENIEIIRWQRGRPKVASGYGLFCIEIRFCEIRSQYIAPCQYENDGDNLILTGNISDWNEVSLGEYWAEISQTTYNELKYSWMMVQFPKDEPEE